MKKKTAIIMSIIIIVGLIFQNSIFASNIYSDIDTITTPSENSLYRNKYDYVIDAYDINMNVTEDNKFEITEKITAFFYKAKHGIYRKLPVKNTVQRSDGTTSTNNARITNVSADTNYSISRENGNYVIKIGSSSRTVTGSQTYTIRYTYNIGNDPVKNYDELYYNFIGTQSDVPIGNVTFKITMPKEFDESKLGFSTGTKGVSGYDTTSLEYTVSGNTIIGSYNKILEVGEGINIRLELPEGYFVKQVYKITFLDYALIAVPIIFLVISFILWNKYGRDDQVVETVEFYPPEGLNSLDLGRIYKGNAEQKHVTSLLVYLANKGYIKITETQEKSILSSKNSFEITKLKDYDGNNEEERLFMEGLFRSKDSVTKSDLYDNFYTTVDKILRSANRKENREKIFKKSASSKIKYVVLMLIITVLLVVVGLMYGGNVNAIVSAIGPISIMFSVYVLPVIFSFIFGKSKQTRVSIAMLLAIILFGTIGVLSLSGNIDLSLGEPIVIIELLINLISIIGMGIFAAIMPSRTTYGNEMLGKIKGFKTFLETAEKEKLEMMVNENPTYFYDILPYTYALGVSEKWMSKFESIALQAPDWYDGYTTFEMMRFNAFMRSTMTSATTAMTSSPSSSGGGSGFSGGGFSGGGSGGGGVGSW